MKRIVIVDGLRSPFCRAGGPLKNIKADELGSVVARELLTRLGVGPKDLDEVIIGNVGQPAHCANIARIVALKAGVDRHVPALTVHRNCASGMEAVTTAAERILSGRAKMILAGGTESMSQLPLLFGPKMTALFGGLMKAKKPLDKLKVLSKFRPSFLKPIIGIQVGLTDPFSGLNMGQTAEVLSREMLVTRVEQDAFALESHHRALSAAKDGFFEDEIHGMGAPPHYSWIEADDGPMAHQSMERLTKLKPYFDRTCGTVTVGNACPVTDGACMLLICDEETAQQRGWSVLGYLDDWCATGLDGDRMGLGPVYATSELFKRNGWSMEDVDRIELNEAFAAQVLANERAWKSDEFARQYLNREEALGLLPMAKTNVNGGAIALGHPVGSTGARLILTLLRELKRCGGKKGLGTLCIGGGQGMSVALEAA